jgi:hypothetical protein
MTAAHQWKQLNHHMQEPKNCTKRTAAAKFVQTKFEVVTYSRSSGQAIQ